MNQEDLAEELAEAIDANMRLVDALGELRRDEMVSGGGDLGLTEGVQNDALALIRRIMALSERLPDDVDAEEYSDRWDDVTRLND